MRLVSERRLLRRVPVHLTFLSLERMQNEGVVLLASIAKVMLITSDKPTCSNKPTCKE
jgi:hypothetical protein